MRFHDATHNRQAEAGPIAILLAVASARLVDAIEAVPDSRQVLRIDPHAGIYDSHVDPAVARRNANLHTATGRRVLDGVEHQIGDRAFDAIAVEIRERLTGGLKLQCARSGRRLPGAVLVACARWGLIGT